MNKKIFRFVFLLLLIGSLAFAGGGREAPAEEPEAPEVAVPEGKYTG